jgi:hypothetical protein
MIGGRRLSADRVAKMLPLVRTLLSDPGAFCDLDPEAIDVPVLISLLLEEHRQEPIALGFVFGFVVECLTLLGFGRDEIVLEVDRVFVALGAVGRPAEKAILPS